MASEYDDVGFSADDPKEHLLEREDIDPARRLELREMYGWIRTYFKIRPARYVDLQTNLNQGRFGKNYDEYLTRSVYYALIGGLVGMLAGLLLTVYLSSTGVIAGLESPLQAPDDVRTVVGANRTLIVGLLVSLSVGLGISVIIWYLRLSYPKSVANSRRRSINVTLPHAIIYMYALSHGGMNLYAVIEELADSQSTYGEVAREFEGVIRDTELFGNDLYTALTNARNLTPSQNLEQFIDDMLSVIDSGGDMTLFLENESENYIAEAEDEQEQFLETLALLSEVFVVGFVAAPLFLIVILLVMSLMGANTLLQLLGIIYVVLPLGIAGFIILLDVLSKPYKQERISAEDEEEDTERFIALRLVGGWLQTSATSLRTRITRHVRGARGQPPHEPSAEERAERNYRRYRQHQRKQALMTLLYQPVVAVKEHPQLSLVVTLPLSFLMVGVFVTLGISDLSIAAFTETPIKTTTALVCLPGLVATVPLAILHEQKARRRKRITERFPDSLNILSSANKMGIQFTDALGLVARWTKGPIGEELILVRNDISWNYDTVDALQSCATRLNTPRLSRTVRLIGGGIRSSSDLSRILSIAAEDTRRRYKMDRKRYRELSSYTMVVVIGFLVYLMVILLLVANYLDPIAALPETPVPEGRNSPIAATNIDVSTYKALFYHSALIQGVGTGLIAGKLADNSLLSGLKYSILLVALAIVAFHLI
jgi:flagellar protein FlaJ